MCTVMILLMFMFCVLSMAGAVSHASSHAEALPETLLPKTTPDNTSRNKLDESFIDTLMRYQVNVLTPDVNTYSLW